MKVLRILTAIAALNVASQASAIQILGDDPVNGTYSAARHDRYYVGPDKDFIGAPLNLSGVSHAEHTYGAFGTWATMISDTYFISANHLHPSANPSNPGRVTFHREDDPVSNYWQADVAAGFQVGNSDLWIGQLASAPPTWVRRYPLLRRPENYNYLRIDAVNSEIYVIGKAHSPNPSASAPDPLNGVPNTLRVGRNSFEFLDNDVSVQGSIADMAVFAWDDGSFMLDEAMVAGGDSGAPSFTLLPSVGSALVGMHSGVYGVDGADTNISFYVDAITAAVPENISVVSDLRADFNADFKVDGLDLAVLSANWNQGPGKRYEDGDSNLDGYVNGIDLADLTSSYNSTLFASADFSRDFSIALDDLETIASNWTSTVAAGVDGDANGDQVVNELDLYKFNELFPFHNATYPSTPYPGYVTGDFDASGTITAIDQGILAQHFNQVVAPGTLGDIDFSGYVDSIDLSLFVALPKPNLPPIDMNQDNQVDVLDLIQVFQNWQMAHSGSEFGDFDDSGFVDSEDLEVLFRYYGWGVDNASEIASPPVPEPTSSALFGIALTCYFLRGWRQFLNQCRAAREAGSTGS